MSREEVVFTKKAIVVVSVISVIASNIVIGFMAAMWLWRFSDQIEAKTTAAATQAAMAAVEITVRPVRDEQIRHKVDDEAYRTKTDGEFSSLKREQERIDRRQSKLEDRLDKRDR